MALLRPAALLALRVTTAGLLLWWGLAKGLDLGVGARVSDKYYGGLFTVDMLLIGFGWVQVALAGLLVLGAFRRPLLWVQLTINGFVAITIWQSFVDPFWLWMPGERPDTLNALFYPSIIVVAGCVVLIA
ncbi:MAG: hypothetical protein AAGI70_12810, partial [Pseudomonadota bacterium]